MDEKVIDNGLDFIVRAARELWDKSLNSEQQLKYSTVHLYEGIELMLKARLMREHWSLILANPDAYKGSPLKTGDFVSVSYERAVDRLAKICGIQLTARQNSAFEGLRKLRNRYVHFTCDDPRESVIGVQLRAWHELLEMFESGFLEPLSYSQGKLLKSAADVMEQSEEFLKARFEAISPDLAKLIEDGHAVVGCPFCEFVALVVKERTCRVCKTNWDDDEHELAETYAEAHFRRWKRDDQRAVYCEVCGECACVPIGDELNDQAGAALSAVEREPGEDFDPYICFACGEFATGWGLKECGSCGARYFSSESDRICPAYGCRGY